MLIPFIRTLILYLLIIAALRFMGKRQVSEMQPSELVITILISAVASVPIQDVGIPLTHGVVPILTLIAAEIILSSLALKSQAFRRLVIGNPVTVITNGTLNQHALRKLRFSLDDIFADLRQKDIFDIRQVQHAQIETSGKISVLLDPRYSPATPLQLGINVSPTEAMTVIVADGKISRQGLKYIGKDVDWAEKIIRVNGVQNTDEVFLLCADSNGSTVFLKKEKPES